MDKNNIRTMKVENVREFIWEVYKNTTFQGVADIDSYGDSYLAEERVFDIEQEEIKVAFLKILEKLNKGESISRETALLMAILHEGVFEEISPSNFYFNEPTPEQVAYFVEESNGEIPLEFSFIPWGWNKEWDWKEESSPIPKICLTNNGWETTEPKSFKRLCKQYLGIKDNRFEQLFAQIDTCHSYISNSFSPLMLKYPSRTRIQIDKCTQEEIPMSAKSVIGHADTARAVSSLLGREIPFNNETTKLEWGDVLYVAQSEGDNISFLKVEVMYRW